jgi:hypothetical protein
MLTGLESLDTDLSLAKTVDRPTARISLCCARVPGR